MKKLGLYVLSVALIYLVVMAAVALIVNQYLQHKTEALVRYSAQDIAPTFDSLIDSTISHIALAIVRSVGSPERKSVEEMAELAKTYELGEVNFANRDGVIIASNFPECLNANLRDGVSGELLAVTNGIVQSVSQKFRPGKTNPQVVMKYLCVAFPNNGGIVQVGMEIGCAEKTLRTAIPNFLVGWLVGETGYYIVVDRNGIIVGCSKPGTDIVGKCIAATDFVEPVGIDPRRTIYRQPILGKMSTCLDDEYIGYRMICVVPDSEFYAGGRILIGNFALWLLLLFVVFGWLQWKNICANQRLSDAFAELERHNQEDMANAQTIQKTAMPTIFPAFPHDLRHDVFAQMHPAQDVGGDFYDFFYISESRFAILIADVSGKGVPAAMFMMKAKMLIKSLVASTSDLGEAMEETNRRLCDGNEAGMFVTCWLGVVELMDGRVSYVNAGHNPPYIRRLTGETERLNKVSGLFLAGLEDTHYQVYHCQLKKGDVIYLYTDGVNEAENAAHKQFGEERIVRCLTAGGSPQEICRRVKLQVDSFVAGAPQFDDMTMLALVYRSRPQREEIELPAQTENVVKAAEFCERRLRSFGCPDESMAKVLIAVDELSNNIASYSGTDRFTVVCETADFPPMAQITFIDKGKPWNPLTHSDPEVTTPAEEREIGGLGIMMVKQLCDGMYYEYKDGRNLTTIRVALPWRTLMARKVNGDRR